MHKDALWFQVFTAALTGSAAYVVNAETTPGMLVTVAIVIADEAVARMKLEEVKP